MLTKEQRDKAEHWAAEWARSARMFGAGQETAARLTADYEVFAAYLDSITAPEVAPTPAAWRFKVCVWIGGKHFEDQWRVSLDYRDGAEPLYAAPQPGERNLTAGERDVLDSSLLRSVKTVARGKPGDSNE